MHTLLQHDNDMAISPGGRVQEGPEPFFGGSVRQAQRNQKQPSWIMDWWLSSPSLGLASRQGNRCITRLPSTDHVHECSADPSVERLNSGFFGGVDFLGWTRFLGCIALKLKDVDQVKRPITMIL